MPPPRAYASRACALFRRWSARSRVLSSAPRNRLSARDSYRSASNAGLPAESRHQPATRGAVPLARLPLPHPTGATCGPLSKRRDDAVATRQPSQPPRYRPVRPHAGLQWREPAANCQTFHEPPADGTARCHYLRTTAARPKSPPARSSARARLPPEGWNRYETRQTAAC